MVIALNGRRLSDDQIAFLLDALGFKDAHLSLLRDGYRLCAKRAPRKCPADGRLRVTFVWKLAEPGQRATVRLSGMLDARPA